jgi:hypothetical protein
MEIHRIRSGGSYFFCCCKAIKEEFPEITDMQTGQQSELDEEGDENKGIPEETHFVISMNPAYRYPIIAVESCMRGPKSGDIERFFSQVLVNLELLDEFLFEPVFAIDYATLAERTMDVASITLVVHQSQIDAIRAEDATTGDLLRTAQQYADSEYVAIESKVKFNRIKERHSTRGLNRVFRSLVNMLRRSPEVKENFTKLDVRIQDRNFGGRLRLIDLIESKVASEVPAERKRPRSQYYNSTALYDAIRRQLERDFSGEENPAAEANG